MGHQTGLRAQRALSNLRVAKAASTVGFASKNPGGRQKLFLAGTALSTLTFLIAASPQNALAACSTSGVDPVTVLCAANTTTTNTTNAVSPNPATNDRSQQFNADLIGQVNAGVTIDGFGLRLVTTKANGGIAMTNNGNVTTNQTVDGALRLEGNGGAVTYSGNGTVSNTGGGDHGLLITNNGAGTVNATISNNIIAANGSAVRGTTVDGALTVNMTGGTLQGTRGIEVNSTTGNVVINMTGGQIGSAATPALAEGISARTGGAGNLTITTAGPIFARNDDGIDADIIGAGTGDLLITVNAPITSVLDNAIDSVGGIGTKTFNINSSLTAGANGIGIGGNTFVTINVSAGGSIVAAGDGIFIGAGGPGIAITNLGSITANLGLNLTGGPPANVFNAGTITGTGGIAIQMGAGNDTLTIAPSSIINGNVLAAGGVDTFQLGGATGTGTFDAGLIGPAAQYQGFELFRKIDNSTWTLFGTNTGVLPWTIASGTLLVTGNLPNSPFTVDHGVLGGTGTIGSLTVNNGGAVAPGLSIGTLTVTGNVSFAAGSFYEVEANAAGQADRINAGGTATLTGGTVQVLAQPGVYAPTTVYTILNATGGVAGQFANVTDNSIFLDASLSYTANSVLLTLTSIPFASFATTPNQAAVAGALDAGGGPLALAIFTQNTAAGARQAFDALSGEIHASVQTVLMQDSWYTRNAVLNRLRQGGYAGEAGPLAALQYGGPMSAEVYAADFPVKAAPPAVRAPIYTVWAQGLGAWGEFQGDGNAAKVTRDLYGFYTGIDARVWDVWRVGVAAGYTRSDARLAARASAAEIDSWHVAAYAGTAWGALRARLGGALSWHDLDTRRTIAFPGFLDATTAGYDAHTGQIFGEVGYGMALGNVAVEPFAGLAWVHLATDSFAETGGAAALTGAKKDFDTAFTTLGVRIGSVVAVASGMALMPRASLAWQHAFGDVTPTSRHFFATGAGFTVAGVPLARDVAVVEAGVDLAFSPNARVGIAYSGQFGERLSDQAVKGNLLWRF